MPRRTHHLHITLIRLLAAHDLLGEQVVRVAVCLGDKAQERLAHQFAARHPQQAGRLQVDLQNFAALAQREVAHGRQVIQILIARALFVQQHLGAAQLVVLHFQLDLKDLQLVQGSLHCLHGERLSGGPYGGFAAVAGIVGVGNRLGPLAQRIEQFLVSTFTLCHRQLPNVPWWQWHTHRPPR